MKQTIRSKKGWDDARVKKRCVAEGNLSVLSYTYYPMTLGQASDGSARCE